MLDFSLAGAAPFDIVYAARGVMCWISDVGGWMRVAAGALARAGFLYLTDDHPAATMFDEGLAARWSYFHADEPDASVGLDYVGQSGEGVEQNLQWRWSLGDVVTAAADAGLAVRYLHEHPHTFWQRWAWLVERDGTFHRPDGMPAVPLSFTLRADRS